MSDTTLILLWAGYLLTGFVGGVWWFLHDDDDDHFVIFASMVAWPFILLIISVLRFGKALSVYKHRTKPTPEPQPKKHSRPDMPWEEKK